jgi:hypothetical protein
MAGSSSQKMAVLKQVWLCGSGVGYFFATSVSAFSVFACVCRLLLCACLMHGVGACTEVAAWWLYACCMPAVCLLCVCGMLAAAHAGHDGSGASCLCLQYACASLVVQGLYLIGFLHGLWCAVLVLRRQP